MCTGITEGGGCIIYFRIILKRYSRERPIGANVSVYMLPSSDTAEQTEISMAFIAGTRQTQFSPNSVAETTISLESEGWQTINIDGIVSSLTPGRNLLSMKISVLDPNGEKRSCFATKPIFATDRAEAGKSKETQGLAPVVTVALTPPGSSVYCSHFPEKCRSLHRAVSQASMPALERGMRRRRSHLLHQYVLEIFFWRFEYKPDGCTENQFNGQSVAHFHCNTTGISTQFFTTSKGESVLSCMHVPTHMHNYIVCTHLWKTFKCSACCFHMNIAVRFHQPHAPYRCTDCTRLTSTPALPPLVCTVFDSLPIFEIDVTTGMGDNGVGIDLTLFKYDTAPRVDVKVTIILVKEKSFESVGIGIVPADRTRWQVFHLNSTAFDWTLGTQSHLFLLQVDEFVIINGTSFLRPSRYNIFTMFELGGRLTAESSGGGEEQVLGANSGAQDYEAYLPVITAFYSQDSTRPFQNIRGRRSIDRRSGEEGEVQDLLTQSKGDCRVEENIQSLEFDNGRQKLLYPDSVDRGRCSNQCSGGSGAGPVDSEPLSCRPSRYRPFDVLMMNDGILFITTFEDYIIESCHCVQAVHEKNPPSLLHVSPLF